MLFYSQLSIKTEACQQELGHQLNRRRLSTDSDSEVAKTVPQAMPVSNWESEFNGYINTKEVVPEGMTMVEWWGVRVYSLAQTF